MPCGYDRNGNTYYILDDNRLYRQTPWIMEPRPVKKMKTTAKRNKRRRVSNAVEEEPAETLSEWQGGEWSCVCITLQEWTTFIGGLEKSKDPDEKALCAHLKEDVMPIINKAWQEKEKQRQLEAAVANRKRSSRLDEKLARQREEEERAAAARREAEASAAEEREKFEAEKNQKVLQPAECAPETDEWTGIEIWSFACSRS
jgi:flagellar biosynthesis GTPase FlhF